MHFPLLLYTYLAAEVLAPLFASFIILNAVLFLGRMVSFLDMLIDLNIAAADFIRLVAYLSPQLFHFSIPMATMTGVIIGLSRLAIDGEIMALKACGIGVYRMLPPVVAIGLATALLAGFFSTRLMPAGHIAMQQLLFKLASEKFERGLREKHFSDAIGNVVLYADQINRENGEWQGVYVTDLRDSRRPVVILAQNGRLGSEPRDLALTLSLRNGSIYRADGDITQNIRFGRYTMALGMPAGGSLPKIALNKKSCGLAQLQEQAARLDPESEERTELLVEYHRRLALPAGCLILALLALPLGLQAGPGQRALGMPIGLVLFILYFIFTSAAGAMLAGRLLAPGLAMWLPNAVFGLLAVMLLRSAALEKAMGRRPRLPAKVPWRRQEIP